MEFFLLPALNGDRGRFCVSSLKPEGALIPPPKDAVQHRMGGVEVHIDLQRSLNFFEMNYGSQLRPLPLGFLQLSDIVE